MYFHHDKKLNLIEIRLRDEPTHIAKDYISYVVCIGKDRGVNKIKIPNASKAGDIAKSVSRSSSIEEHIVQEALDLAYKASVIKGD